MQLFDQGKQAKHVPVPNEIRPLGSSLPRVVGVDDEGMMEMRYGGDVPRIAGQGACAKTELVVDEMSDDNFNDVLRNPGDRGRARRGSLRRSTP